MDSRDELGRLLNRSVDEYVRRTERLISSVVGRWRDPTAVSRAVEYLGRLIGGTRAVAWMLGRRRVILEADRMQKDPSKGSRMAVSFGAMAWAADQNLIPRVEPEEAIADMIEREPRLAKGYLEVQDIMSRERAFAMARSESMVVTRKVQEEMASLLRKGVGEPEGTAVIRSMGEWTRWYAGVVFRTNMTSAYAAGRFREATSEDLRGFISGIQRVEAMDSETKKRPGHWNAHGIIASPEDPIWNKLSVPGGYGCRASYRLVDYFEASRLGLVNRSGRMRPAPWPPGAYNDPGFDNRVMHPGYGLI